MEILIVTPHFYPENFRINDLAKELNNRSHSITVLTAIPDYPKGKYYTGYGLLKNNRENYNGVKVYRAPIIPRGSGTRIRLALNYFSFIIGSLFSCISLLRKNFDIILVFAPSPITVCIPAIIIKKIKGIPICLWVQDLWPDSVAAAGNLKSNFIPNLIEPLVKFIYKHSDKILISSKGYKNSIVKKGISASKIIFLPNWAENVFRIIKSSNISFSFIPSNSFKIMFAGNIGIAQDFKAILESARMLKDKNVHWLILGNGSQKNWVKNKLKDYNLNHCFHLLGSYPTEKMPMYYSYADAMLFALKDKYIFSLTLPSKVQSYLACGKPILAMINGEASDLINNNNSGLVCSAGDSYGLSKNILKMAKMTRNELDLIGNNSLKCYKKNFDRKMLIDKIENILFSLIQ